MFVLDSCCNQIEQTAYQKCIGLYAVDNNSQKRVLISTSPVN